MQRWILFEASPTAIGRQDLTASTSNRDGPKHAEHPVHAVKIPRLVRVGIPS